MKKLSLTVFAALTPLLPCAGPCGAQSTTAVVSPADYLECGVPLAIAQLESLNIHFSGGSYASPSAVLLPSSRARLEEIRFGLGELAPEEKIIAGRFMQFNFPLVHRTRIDRLRSILAGGGLLSPREAFRHGIDLRAHTNILRIKNPQPPPLRKKRPPFPGDSVRIQNLFEGSFDCVFASISDRTGKDSYGDIIVNIDLEKVTPRMLVSLRPVTQLAQRDDISYLPETPAFRDQLTYYSRKVYSGAVLKELLGLLLIARIREQAEMRGDLQEQLAKAVKADSFYGLLDSRLSALEAKIPKKVTLDEIESILVPEKDLAEVLSWEEAKPLAGKIRGYAPPLPEVPGSAE